MPSNYPAKFVWLFSLVLLGCIPMQAQDPTLERGLKPYGAFEGGSIDSVSMTNGNLNIHIPLVSYPQRGGKLHLAFFLRYINGSHVDTPANLGCAQPPHVCSWGTSIAGSLLEIAPDIGFGITPDFSTGTLDSFGVLITPDGSTHEMGPVSGGLRSIDASGFLCVNTCATIIDRDGIRYTFPTTGAVTQKIEDPNGNYITVGSSNNGLTPLVDTLNRAITVPPIEGSGGTGFTSDFTGCTGTLPTVAAYPWTLPGYQGGPQNFKICYASVYYGRHALIPIT